VVCLRKMMTGLPAARCRQCSALADATDGRSFMSNGLSCYFRGMEAKGHLLQLGWIVAVMVQLRKYLNATSMNGPLDGPVQ